MCSLAIRAAAGQVLCAGFPAGEPPPDLMHAVRAGELAGLILFRRNVGSPEELVELNTRLRSLAPADRPLWLAVDQEGGRVARLRAPFVALPPARVFGDLDDPELTYDAGLELGQQLGWAGFNLDFAPVVDIDTNPENPVIGDRSYARDVTTVVRHARAFAAGLGAAGITTCGKHFPGHGDTLLDSHFALPRLAHSEARLRSVELAPFAALRDELPCIMTAHVVFETWDASCPATLSATVVRGLLREDLGFRGVVFSDDLEMQAIQSHYGMEEAACRAIEAGCDVLLVCSQLELLARARAGLIERAERDASFAARLSDAAERSLSARRAQAPRWPAPLAPRELAERLAAAEHARLEARIAEAQAARGRVPGA